MLVNNRAVNETNKRSQPRTARFLVIRKLIQCREDPCWRQHSFKWITEKWPS